MNSNKDELNKKVMDNLMNYEENNACFDCSKNY